MDEEQKGVDRVSGVDGHLSGVPGRWGAVAAGCAGEPEVPAEVIQRAIMGDQAAQRDLWHRHRRWVAAVLLAHAPRDAEIDDLLQEVALAVVAKISGLREAGAFKPWLRAVAISIAKTAARRRNVRKAGWLKLVGFAGQTDAAREAAWLREAATGVGGGGGGGGGGVSLDATIVEGRRLLELSSELPDGYREPLLLKCVQGMSYKQIGEVMGLPDTTIETRIARARRMLREKAESDGLNRDERETQAARAASEEP